MTEEEIRKKQEWFLARKFDGETALHHFYETRDHLRVAQDKQGKLEEALRAERERVGELVGGCRELEVAAFDMWSHTKNNHQILGLNLRLEAAIRKANTLLAHKDN